MTSKNKSSATSLCECGCKEKDHHIHYDLEAQCENDGECQICECIEFKPKKSANLQKSSLSEGKVEGETQLATPLATLPVDADRGDTRSSLSIEDSKSFVDEIIMELEDNKKNNGLLWDFDYYPTGTKDIIRKAIALAIKKKDEEWYDKVRQIDAKKNEAILETLRCERQKTIEEVFKEIEKMIAWYKQRGGLLPYDWDENYLALKKRMVG